MSPRASVFASHKEDERERKKKRKSRGDKKATFLRGKMRMEADRAINENARVRNKFVKSEVTGRLDGK